MMKHDKPGVLSMVSVSLDGSHLPPLQSPIDACKRERDFDGPCALQANAGKDTNGKHRLQHCAALHELAKIMPQLL